MLILVDKYYTLIWSALSIHNYKPYHYSHLQTGGASGFVLLLEIFHAKVREFASIASEALWVAGYMLAGMVGYLAWDWRHYQMVASLAPLLVLLYIWLVMDIKCIVHTSIFGTFSISVLH